MFGKAGRRGALPARAARAHRMLCNETGRKRVACRPCRASSLLHLRRHHGCYQPRDCGLRMADESVDDGDSMDNSELPPVQLRVEPAATALAAAQAARASREADARRFVELHKRRRCERGPMGAASCLYGVAAS